MPFDWTMQKAVWKDVWTQPIALHKLVDMVEEECERCFNDAALCVEELKEALNKSGDGFVWLQEIMPSVQSCIFQGSRKSQGSRKLQDAIRNIVPILLEIISKLPKQQHVVNKDAWRDCLENQHPNVDTAVQMVTNALYTLVRNSHTDKRGPDVLQHLYKTFLPILQFVRDYTREFIVCILYTNCNQSKMLAEWVQLLYDSRLREHFTPIREELDYLRSKEKNASETRAALEQLQLQAEQQICLKNSAIEALNRALAEQQEVCNNLKQDLEEHKHSLEQEKKARERDSVALDLTKEEAAKNLKAAEARARAAEMELEILKAAELETASVTNPAKEKAAVNRKRTRDSEQLDDKQHANEYQLHENAKKAEELRELILSLWNQQTRVKDIVNLTRLSRTTINGILQRKGGGGCGC